MHIYPIAERTMGRVLKDKARKNDQKTFLYFEDQKFTYKDADMITDRLAAGLLGMGVLPGDHVSVIMGNHPNIIWTIFALGKMGAVAVPINTAAKGEQLRYFLDQSDSKILIIDEEFLDRVSSLRDQLPKMRKLIGHSEEGNIPSPKKWPWELTNLASLLEKPKEQQLPEVKFNDHQLIMYTSGTTGPSKGVLNSQAQVQAAGYYMAYYMGYKQDDILYTALPLFHANAFRNTLIAAIWADAAVVVSRRFSATNFWDEIRKYGANQFNSLGAMTNIIWKQPENERDCDNPVRICNVVPILPRDMYQAFEKRFNLQITSLYGTTEVSCPTMAGPDTPREKQGTCGKLLPGFDMKVVDDDDFELPPGKAGEFVVRPLEPWIIFSGYYNMPETNLKEWRNLWHHTGDRGYRDEDGYFYFVDRKKESIRRRGENISSYEVEFILSRHPKVSEVAVVAVPSEMSEDEVMAYVVPSPGEKPSELEMIRFCEENMAYFMVPRYIQFLSELPKTSTEKVEKFRLTTMALENLDRIWDREKIGYKIKR